MGSLCSRQDFSNAQYGICARIATVDGICARDEVRGARGQLSPAAAARSKPAVVHAQNFSRDTQGSRAELLPERRPRTGAGLPPDAVLQQGDQVLVKRELGGGYHVVAGDAGKVLHVDSDGDALIAFPEQEEQWVHSSLFPKLERVSQDIPLYSQLWGLLKAFILAVCGWNIFAGAAEAAYWQFVAPGSEGAGDLETSVYILGAGFALYLAMDCCGLQVFASRYSNALAALPPLLLALSGWRPGAGLAAPALAAAAVSQGLSVLAVLGSSATTRRRQVTGWGVLLAVVAMPLLRWSWASANPILTVPSTRIHLGLAGVLSAVASAWEGDPATALDPDCGSGCILLRFDVAGWPGALSTGLMTASTFGVFRAYLSSLQQPALTAFPDPPFFMALPAVGALGAGSAALAAVWSMTPWWLDTCQAALVIGVLPLIACGLQATAGVHVDNWGPVPGSGLLAYGGLLMLVAIFPFMLALTSKEMALLAPRSLGRATFVAGALMVAEYLVWLSVVLGPAAPYPVPQLEGRLWMYSVGLGAAFCAGVWAAPTGGGRPSVHDLWYLSRHSGPPRREYSAGALGLLGLLLAAFLAIAVPTRMAHEFVQEPLDPSLLVVAGFNVQQGFDLHGAPNVDCVAGLLQDANVDLVGLSEASSPPGAAGSSDPTAAVASRLKMRTFRAAPASLPSPGQTILSRLPLQETSVSALVGPKPCEACQAPAQIWSRATVPWQGFDVAFQTVHLNVERDAASQVRLLADGVRASFPEGPLILVASFGFADRALVHSGRAILAELVRDTGLMEVFGSIDDQIKAPLPPTEFVSGHHEDFVFYRGVELVGKWVHSRRQCSNHMLTVASFRAKLA